MKVAMEVMKAKLGYSWNLLVLLLWIAIHIPVAMDKMDNVSLNAQILQAHGNNITQPQHFL